MFPVEFLPGFNDENGTFRQNVRLSHAVIDHQGELVSYRDLPITAQLVVAIYMGIEGEAWEPTMAIRKAVAKGHPCYDADAMQTIVAFFVKKYGDEKFGFIPAMRIKTLIEWCMEDADIKQDHGSWESFHATFLEANSEATITPSPVSSWPVILSSFDDEVLSTGWTQLHSCVRRKLGTCPAIFYPNIQNA